MSPNFLNNQYFFLITQTIHGKESNLRNFSSYKTRIGLKDTWMGGNIAPPPFIQGLGQKYIGRKLTFKNRSDLMGLIRSHFDPFKNCVFIKSS